MSAERPYDMINMKRQYLQSGRTRTQGKNKQNVNEIDLKTLDNYYLLSITSIFFK